jgi:hypothetical protein
MPRCGYDPAVHFEVTPAPVVPRRGPPWVLAALVIVLILVVGGALVGRQDTAAPQASQLALVTGQPPTAPASAAPLTLQPPSSPLLVLAQGPSTSAPGGADVALTCHEVASPSCQRLAVAALRALPSTAPTVVRADVWPTILCDSPLDCPPTRLGALTRPLGSVVLDFGDGGPEAFLNVVARTAGASPTASSSPGPQSLMAWVVSW